MECFDHPVSISDCGKWMRGRTIEFSDTTGLRILELAQESYSLYVRQNSFEQRKLLDMILSNCELRDGKIVAEFGNFFQILADGVAEEEQMAAENIPFDARNKNWLPG